MVYLPKIGDNVIGEYGYGTDMVKQESGTIIGFGKRSWSGIPTVIIKIKGGTLEVFPNQVKPVTVINETKIIP